MKTAYFRSRCLVCWKSFEVPKLSDMSYGETLYYEKSIDEFGYFNWIENQDKEKIISLFLDTDPELQFKNDETKGNIAVKIIGLIADGDWEPILGHSRCPRCKYKFNYVSKRRSQIKNINLLSFKSFDVLKEDEQIEYLKEKTKTGL
ncbi:MAG: hypothetical protein AAF944_00165 [Bacteroidota bacterium]